MIRNFLKKNTKKPNIKRGFSMSPDPKFFLLRFTMKNEEERPGIGNRFKLLEDQYDHLKPYEEKRIVHLATREKNEGASVLIFQAENETVPYHFLKSSPLYIGGYVDKFKIEELDIRADVGAGELARVFTYLASV